MKVKKGMASSVSFDMMPQTRSGSACRKLGWKRSSWMPRTREAQADEGQREGDRVAEEQEDDQRHEHDRRHVVDEEADHRAAYSIGT